MKTYNKLYIGGKWQAPVNQEVLEIRSPHDQSVVGNAAQASKKWTPICATNLFTE